TASTESSSSTCPRRPSASGGRSSRRIDLRADWTILHGVAGRLLPAMSFLEHVVKFGVGQPHVRVEDPSLLTGQGRYLADRVPEGALRAVVVRSPHAHAKFKIVNANVVRGMPGVRLVLTAAETAAYGSVPCQGV